MRKITYINCPICGKEFQSLGYASHRAMHSREWERTKKLQQPPVSNSLPVDFLQSEMIKAIKELAKESTVPDKDTRDWLESDIKRGAKKNLYY